MPKQIIKFTLMLSFTPLIFPLSCVFQDHIRHLERLEEEEKRSAKVLF